MAYQHIFSIWKCTTVQLSLNRYITQEVNWAPVKGEKCGIWVKVKFFLLSLVFPEWFPNF